tara:strand:- start:176 stop:625 length:450 start_codon:yes stop_codon:yes gene_type:complete
MATTITSADLTVTITEAIALNGVDQGGSHTLTISNINEVDRRIFTAGTSEVDVLGFGSANGQGQYTRTAVKYIRITNLDDTNFATIGVSDSGADTFYVKLDAGKSFVMGNDDLEIHATGGASSAFSEADSISAKADTADVDLEVFVATT